MKELLTRLAPVSFWNWFGLVGLLRLFTGAVLMNLRPKKLLGEVLLVSCFGISVPVLIASGRISIGPRGDHDRLVLYSDETPLLFWIVIFIYTVIIGAGVVSVFRRLFKM
jgi:hypothetical protein